MQRSKFSFLKEGPVLDTYFHLSSQYCGSINIRKINLKHFKSVNHRHSSDEETANQTKCFTKVSTTVLLPHLGEEKALLTSGAFKKVSLDIIHTGKQEQVSLFLAIYATLHVFWGVKKPQKMHGWPLLGYIYFHPSASCVSGSKNSSCLPQSPRARRKEKKKSSLSKIKQHTA